jgi:hypothetical protein
MKKGKVLPNELFQFLKEVRRIEKGFQERGLDIKIEFKVMDGLDYLRSCMKDDEELKKEWPHLFDDSEEK